MFAYLSFQGLTMSAEKLNTKNINPLKQNKIAYKFNSPSAFYRILDKSRSSQRLHNVLYLWKINQKYNNFKLLRNLFSIFMISINSLIKYGFK